MTDTATSFIGFTAGVLCALSFLPQVHKVWKSRSARDISLGMYSLFVSGVALWLVYGMLLGSMPIVMANALTLVFALAILVMKLRFG